MKTLSTYLIVKNEESVIKRCIDSIDSFSDEIIITDTGSNDKTKEIIKNLNNPKIKLYDFEWCYDFSKARNFSLGKTTCEYVLTTDADEVFEESLQKEILNFKENDFFNFEKIFVPLVNFNENGNEIETLYYDSRSILKKENEPYWINPVHEHLYTHKEPTNVSHLSNGRIFHKKHGGAFSQYPKYKEIFLKSITDDPNLFDVDCDYLSYFYFTLLWNDIPLCKSILSKTFSYDYINKSTDYRGENFLMGRLTHHELFVMTMINDPEITKDKLKIKLLFDIINNSHEDDTSQYLAFEFFKDNRNNDLFKPYLHDVYKKLSKKELEYNFPKDYIETSELLYKIDNSTFENFVNASELKDFMNKTNIIIMSESYKYSLIYYATRYFNNIFVITDNFDSNLPICCKQYCSINDVLTETNFEKTLIIESNQQIFTTAFSQIYNDFRLTPQQIFHIRQ